MAPYSELTVMYTSVMDEEDDIEEGVELRQEEEIGVAADEEDDDEYGNISEGGSMEDEVRSSSKSSATPLTRLQQLTKTLIALLKSCQEDMHGKASSLRKEEDYVLLEPCLAMKTVHGWETTISPKLSPSMQL